MKKKNIVMIVATLLFISIFMPIINSLNNVNDTQFQPINNNASYQPQQHTIQIGICDNFTLPSEQTYPGTELLDWISQNYPYSETKDCDEDPENRYWAHTVYLNEEGACVNNEIETVFIEITFRCDHDNDHLKVGCVTDPSAPWNLNGGGKRLDDFNNVDIGDVATIMWEVTDLYPTFLDNVNTYRRIDIAVDDDSPVDCAKVIIQCVEICECELEIEIQSGLHNGAVPVVISNVGTTDCYNITWTISNIVNIGSATCSDTGMISSLSPSTPQTVTCSPTGFISFLEIIAEASVCSNTITYSDTANAIILGPFIFVY